MNCQVSHTYVYVDITVCFTCMCVWVVLCVHVCEKLPRWLGVSRVCVCVCACVRV